ncbi:hypothetical protein NKG60_29790 [Mesorhizobium sp. M1428]|uniref:hypothetical protein n=1 Tax=unclassified Mesorhizobium TaxID=325217 RepID=UPI003334ECFA
MLGVTLDRPAVLQSAAGFSMSIAQLFDSLGEGQAVIALLLNQLADLTWRNAIFPRETFHFIKRIDREAASVDVGLGALVLVHFRFPTHSAAANENPPATPRFGGRIPSAQEGTLAAQIQFLGIVAGSFLANEHQLATIPITKKVMEMAKTGASSQRAS